MRTSELSLLFDSKFSNNYSYLNNNFMYFSDENMSGESVVSNLQEQQKYNNEAKAGNAKYGYTYEVTLDSEIDKKTKTTKGQNFIKNTVSSTYARGSNNPYLNLLKDFNDKNTEELHLELQDFIYLRDIGVHPVNKLMILRRYGSAPQSPDITYMKTNRNIKMGKPVSKVVGWVKDDDDIFNISFNEVWKSQNEWLHEVIKGIIQDQFGTDISTLFPMPGWGQSIMFSFLNKMGWTSYDGNNLPIGDANLLRSGVTRETEGNGLATTMNLKLETTYELKYIENVDPTIVFHSIISNLLNMGTENIKFLFRGGRNIQDLLNLAADPNMKDLIRLVTNMINQIIDVVIQELNTIKTSKFVKDNESKVKVAENDELKAQLNKAQAEAKLAEGKKLKDGQQAYSYNDPITGEPGFVSLYGKNSAQRSLDRTTSEQNKKETELSARKKTLGDRLLSFLDIIGGSEAALEMITGFMNSILTSTLARYKWPIRGAIAQATGMNMTPWHLTIGNPKAPIISMNHIKVDNVEIKLSGDLLYNDLPRYITATISISNTRPFGKQEIFKFFGNTFIREYASSAKFYQLDEETIKKFLNQKE